MYWLGNSRSVTVKDLYRTWLSSPEMRQWLSHHVNPSSADLYYGMRWVTHDPLPAIGTTIRRPHQILQWSTREGIARWFAGIGTTGSKDGWLGGVLMQTKAAGRNIIVDVDAFSTLCGQHREEFAALVQHSEARAMFSGDTYEGEVLTTAIRAKVIEASLF